MVTFPSRGVAAALVSSRLGFGLWLTGLGYSLLRVAVFRGVVVILPLLFRVGGYGKFRGEVRILDRCTWFIVSLFDAVKPDTISMQYSFVESIGSADGYCRIFEWWAGLAKPCRLYDVLTGYLAIEGSLPRCCWRTGPPSRAGCAGKV